MNLLLLFYRASFCHEQEHAKAEEERTANERQGPRIGDEFLLNVGGEVNKINFKIEVSHFNIYDVNLCQVFVTSKETLCKYSNSRFYS